MTLRELINSVDSEQYSDSALYQKLRETKPEHGANRRIQVKLVNGKVTITNVHVGSLGDILTYQMDGKHAARFLEELQRIINTV